MRSPHPIRTVLAFALSFAPAASLAQAPLVVPTAAQAAWQDLELGVFFHFGINTFHGVEWSDGTLDPRTFDPRDLDAEEWVRTAKEAGARYLLLTAKHHDGFCLWPTRTTDYSVRSSPWKGGAGDVVREVAAACRKHELKLGLYLSPWDRHEPCYGDREAYDRFYRRQLEELLTGYGPLVEVWFDGAGSEGREYDWPGIIALVRRHQPEAMVFNMGAPTIRWSGNEKGYAPEPCWNVVREEDVLRFAWGKARSDGSGTVWLPVECDVSIRGGWFWHPGGEKTLKSLEDLLVIYYRSVGRGANLLLNVPPDRRGRLPEADAARLRELAGEVRRRFEAPLAAAAGEGEEVVLDLGEPRNVDHLVSMEDIRHGERVKGYAIELRVPNAWLPVARGTAIGHKRIDVFAPIIADAVRLRVTSSAARPVFRSVAAFGVGDRSRIVFGRTPAGLLAEAESAAAEGDLQGALGHLEHALTNVPAYAPAHAARGELLARMGRSEPAARDLDLAASLMWLGGPRQHLRAVELFKLGRFRESAAAFDEAVAAGGRTHSSDECWERGLARYYAGDLAGGRSQFEGYHRVGPLDIENGLWIFLCAAPELGVEKARALIPEYRDRRRPPFPALLDLYLGKGSVDAVLAQAREASEGPEREERLFYAHLYAAKHLQAAGEPERARAHVAEALARPVDHFMLWCARAEAARARL